jgi:hypothetical protein
MIRVVFDWMLYVQAIAVRTALPGVRILDPVAFLATLPQTP